MYAKGKGSGVPSDGQAREKLALYVYEYLLHVGAQKSAQTFLSEIRWEKNITLGEPPGFLHSWWCVFWDLYCAAPDRRETCEHSSEAKAFHDYSAAAAPSPVMGNLPPGDAMAGGPVPPAFFQVPSPACPWRVRTPEPRGHPGMGGPMQRMNPPRGMAGMGPQSYGSGMRPPPSSLAGPGMPTMNMGPGGRGPWPNPNANSIAYSSSSPGNYVGPPGGGGPPGTPILPSPGDSTNSSENMYTMMNPIGPAGNRPNFPMGPGPEGPMGGMSAMEPHHMNGSLGSGDMDGLPKSSPSNLGALSNPPGTPRDDAELSSNFLNPFQSDSVRDPAGTPADPRGGRRRGRGARGGRGRGGSANKSHWRPPEIVSASPAAAATAATATAVGSPWPSEV
ncbi:PREDICTED: single-stranded DNA-binding protein 4 [Sturnus vulgaris]|uniref:single-stranded DNA-binding protein 4 n=1 Tax=Sturnus vulgaris TaxID=9172 RepID=UPI00071A62F7|nr:PREDICTED: single-stranded DNA-binding protein 4 [Sturnus vulgaris]